MIHKSELGEHADQLHRETGGRVAAEGIDELLVIGERGGLVCEGAREGGMAAAATREVRDAEEAAAALDGRLREGDWVLVKGSRAMRMEDVVARLTGTDAGNEAN